MQLEKKAAYNLLKMHHPESKERVVPTWKTENYRAKETAELFHELQKHNIFLDKASFLAYSEEVQSPEDLSECLVLEDTPRDAEDHIYLIIFELWRRFIPERPSLSIFCDELDEQICLYDQGTLKSEEPLQDAFNNLQLLLEENVDAGQDPFLLFETVEAHSIHDLASFLYDFISEKIDQEQLIYASELLEGFYPYIKEKSWFDFLRVRLSTFEKSQDSAKLIKKLIQENPDDIELYLEVLQFLTHFGDHHTFTLLAQKTLPLLETEDQLQDLLHITTEYFHCLDREKEEKMVEQLLLEREKNGLESLLDPSDKCLQKLTSLFMQA